MTYSLYFRKKVLAIKEQEGLTGKEASVRFGIGEANITRWNNCLEQQRTRNKAATKLDMEALEQDEKEYTDAYQYERASRLGVSQRAIGYALERLKVSYKKNTVASKSERRGTTYLSRQDKRLSGGQQSHCLH